MSFSNIGSDFKSEKRKVKELDGQFFKINNLEKYFIYKTTVSQQLLCLFKRWTTLYLGKSGLVEWKMLEKCEDVRILDGLSLNENSMRKGFRVLIINSEFKKESLFLLEWIIAV